MSNQSPWEGDLPFPTGQDQASAGQLSRGRTTHPSTGPERIEGIPLMDDYLRMGSLVLRRTSQGGFEILPRVADPQGLRMACGHVETADFPTLPIRPLPPQERSLDMSAPPRDRRGLARGSEALPTDSVLRAAAPENRMEILLSGHPRSRCFWWRAQITRVQGEIRVPGPVISQGLMTLREGGRDTRAGASPGLRVPFVERRPPKGVLGASCAPVVS